MLRKNLPETQRKASPILLQNPTVTSAPLVFPNLALRLASTFFENKVEENARNGEQWKQDFLKVSDSLFPRQICSRPFFRCLFVKTPSLIRAHVLWEHLALIYYIPVLIPQERTAIWLPDSLSGQDHRANLLVKQTKAVNTHARTCNRQQMLHMIKKKRHAECVCIWPVTSCFIFWLDRQECVIKACESRDDGLVDKEVFVSYLPQPWPSKSALVNSGEGAMHRCQSLGSRCAVFNLLKWAPETKQTSRLYTLRGHSHRTCFWC